LTEAQATVVTAYTGLSTSAGKAAADLAVTPPPTIEGGDAVATDFATAFQNLSDVYGRGAQTIAAVTPVDEKDRKDQKDGKDPALSGSPTKHLDAQLYVQVTEKRYRGVRRCC